MASWLSENLNEREVISTSPTRLHGWSLTNTGRLDRFVAFKDKERTAPMIVVPPGEERSMSGLDEPFPNGLAIESLTGDGKLTASVFYTQRAKAQRGKKSKQSKKSRQSKQTSDITVEVRISGKNL